MSTDEPTALVPPPEPSTIEMMRQVSTYNMQRTGIAASTREVLGNTLEDYQERIRLMLSIYGTHRMRRLSAIAGATDHMEERLRDPAYLDALARQSPSEFRKLYAQLKEVERDDVEFLRLQAADSAEKDGFSRDPKKNFNSFFNRVVINNIISQDMGIDERRKTRAFIDEMFAMVEKRLPVPPQKSTRVQDVPFDVSEKAPPSPLSPTNGTNGSNEP